VIRSMRERIAWLAATVFLGLEIRFDFVRVLDPVFKWDFQADSDLLVRNEMLNPGDGIFPALGGTELEYLSQVGLQGLVLNWVSPGDQFYDLLRLITAMLTGAVLATAVFAARRAWGNRAAGVLFVLLALSFWTNGFGASTYWQLWTFLLPILVPLLMWPRLGDGRRKWLRGGALIAFLVFVKCLCGYEFISTLLLGVAAAVGYHEFRGRIDRRLLGRLVLAMSAGLAGFLAALGLHVALLMARIGDASAVKDRVLERTVSPDGIAGVLADARAEQDPLWGWLVQGDSTIGLWAYQFVHYLTDPAIALPARPFAGFGPTAYTVPIWAFIAVFLLLAAQAYRGRQEDAAVQRRLALAAGLGLLGALSWLVLAYGHMINHTHIDAIVFYLPFLPLVFGMIAVRIETVSRRAWPRRPAADADRRSGSGQSPVDAGPPVHDLVGVGERRG
jgi:hypothetical protein